MYTKVTLTSLLKDTKDGTWVFLAHGQDGSTYRYKTFSSIYSFTQAKMFSRLKGLVKEGWINVDYWRLV